ncbi:hypothetical protein Tco_0699522 [Tanacetum coccineum]
MTQKYEMSMMGVLAYFLGFQIKQSERGISINQKNYVKDLLKKHDKNCSSVKTTMVPSNKLGPDLNGKAVNETQYRGFDLKRYSDSNYVGCNMDKRQTSAVAGCCANILWMKSQLNDYDIVCEKHTMEGYGTDEVTFISTQVFNELVAFKAPKTSSQTKKKDIKGKNPRAKSVQRKQILVTMIYPFSNDVTEDIKLGDLSKLVKDVNFDTMELDSLEDDQPFIVLNDEEEEVHVEPNTKTDDTLVPVPPSPKSIKIQEQSTQLLLLQSRNNKLEKEKAAVEAEVALLSAQPSFLNVQQLTEVMSSISALTNKVAALENLKLDLPAGLPGLPGQVIKTQDKGKKALSHEEVAEEEFESNSDDEVRLSSSLVESSKQKPLKKGNDPITLKVYMDDGSDEIILNFKASDLHLREYREVMNACPNRTGVVWTSIYSQIKKRLDNHHKTEEEFKLDFSKPLNRILSSNKTPLPREEEAR